MNALVAAVVRESLAAGIAECCVCAGSRNSELVRALLQTPLRVWHFFEERSAAFFALGRVRVTGQPVAVVTTSGTAAAELFPAMIEAHYQGLPLLAITADRPPHFRGSGAPQAIEQLGLFGDYPSWQLDLEMAEDAENCLEFWPRSGPAHLNVCLEEPQASLAMPDFTGIPARPLFSEAFPSQTLPPIDLVMLGDLLPGERARVQEILHDWQGPVWAEAASGLRAWLGEHLLPGGESALRHWQGRRILRLGGVPSCRFWRDLESRPEIEVISASRSGHPGLARVSQTVALAAIAPVRFQGSPLPSTPNFAAGLCENFPLSECGHLRTLSQILPPHSVLFLGNSLTIRQWNLAAHLNAAEAQCHVMRGANGIDGNLSYFFGLSANAAESWAVVGDLTALYDLAAPWICEQLPAGIRRIVVMNNGGGCIFRRLPSLRETNEAERSVIENSHALRFKSWADQWGMGYRRITSQEDWREPFPAKDCIIEILPDAVQSEAFWQALATP